MNIKSKKKQESEDDSDNHHALNTGLGSRGSGSAPYVPSFAGSLGRILASKSGSKSPSIPLPGAPPPLPPSATPEQKWQHQQLLNFNAIQSSIQAQTTSLLNQQQSLLNVQQQVTNLVNHNQNNPPNRQSNQQTRQQEREKAFHKQLQTFKIKLSCKG